MLELLPAIYTLTFTWHLWTATIASTNISVDLSANPLVYNRLRFEHDFLQLLQNFQLPWPTDEKKYTLRLRNETYRNNETREEVVTYYKNNQLDASTLIHDDLVFEALDRTYRTRLFQSTLYTYDNYEDRLRSSDPSVVSDSKCRRDISFLISNLKNITRLKSGEELRGVAMLPELSAFYDAFAAEEPGLLQGNYHWVGHWRSCKDRQVFLLDRSNTSLSTYFRGRYCIASLRSSRWESKIEQRRGYLEKKMYFKYPQQKYDYTRFFRLQVGICLPDSCDSRLINQHSVLQDLHQLATSKLSGPYKSYSLIDLYCLPDESSELRSIHWSGWLWIAFMGTWCLAISAASLYDNYRPEIVKSKRRDVTQKLVYSFSIIKNYNRLVELDSLRADWNKRQTELWDRMYKRKSETSKETSSNSRSRRQAQLNSLIQDTTSAETGTAQRKLRLDELQFLNAFKALAMPMILFAHTGMIFNHLSRFPLEFSAVNKLSFHALGSSVFYVDWFFVVTGFLAAYINFVQKKVENSSLKYWLYTVLHRYWRLAPTYIILFWFTKSLFHNLSSGPSWDYGTNNMTIRSICHRESWLYPFTLTPNLHPLHEECIMPAWYIGCDMQFYLITPFLLVLLHKSPIKGWIVSLAIIISSITLRVYTYMTNPKTDSLELMRPRQDLYMRTSWDMHEAYLYPQYRVSSYLIGLLSGHYTYMVLSGQWKSVLYWADDRPPLGRSNGLRSLWWRRKLRTMTSLLGLQLVLSMTAATWLIMEFYPSALDKQVKYFTAIVYGFDHSFASLGVALVAVTLMLGQFPCLKHWLAHPYFTFITRFNYCAFLIQVEVIYWVLQTCDRVPELSTIEGFKVFALSTLITYSISALLTLILELPAANLERKFLWEVCFPNETKRPKNGAPNQIRPIDSATDAKGCIQLEICNQQPIDRPQNGKG